MMNRRYVVGIDPGLGGGVAVMDCDFAGSVGVFPMPVKSMSRNKKDVDVRTLRNKLLKYQKEGYSIVLVVVEKVHAHPKQGTVSTFTFGRGLGKILGMVELMDWPLEEPLPQRWKKEVLRDTKMDKDAAVFYAKQRFPSLSLLATERSKKPHYGMADAVCMAEYGRRLLVGNDIG